MNTLKMYFIQNVGQITLDQLSGNEIEKLL